MPHDACMAVPASKALHRSFLAAAALLAVALIAGACSDDDDERVSLEVTAESIGSGDVAIRLVNDGTLAGVVHGCPNGAMTAASSWNGSEWVHAYTLNEDCGPGFFDEYPLAPGDELEYSVSVPPGRYRFTVQFIVEGHFGEGTSTSNAVVVTR